MITLVTVGRYTEDICFDDLGENTQYASYSQTAERWPPAIECHLEGAGEQPLTIRHRFKGTVYYGFLIVVPFGFVCTHAPKTASYENPRCAANDAQMVHGEPFLVVPYVGPPGQTRVTDAIC